MPRFKVLTTLHNDSPFFERALKGANLGVTDTDAVSVLCGGSVDVVFLWAEIESETQILLVREDPSVDEFVSRLEALSKTYHII